MGSNKRSTPKATKLIPEVGGGFVGVNSTKAIKGWDVGTLKPNIEKRNMEEFSEEMNAAGVQTIPDEGTYITPDGKVMSNKEAKKQTKEAGQKVNELEIKKAEMQYPNLTPAQQLELQNQTNIENLENAYPEVSFQNQFGVKIPKGFKGKIDLNSGKWTDEEINVILKQPGLQILTKQESIDTLKKVKGLNKMGDAGSAVKAPLLNKSWIGKEPNFKFEIDEKGNWNKVPTPVSFSADNQIHISNGKVWAPASTVGTGYFKSGSLGSNELNKINYELAMQGLAPEVTTKVNPESGKAVPETLEEKKARQMQHWKDIDKQRRDDASYQAANQEWLSDVVRSASKERNKIEQIINSGTYGRVIPKNLNVGVIDLKTFVKNKDDIMKSKEAGRMFLDKNKYYQLKDAVIGAKKSGQLLMDYNPEAYDEVDKIWTAYYDKLGNIIDSPRQAALDKEIDESIIDSTNQLGQGHGSWLPSANQFDRVKFEEGEPKGSAVELPSAKIDSKKSLYSEFKAPIQFYAPVAEAKGMEEGIYTGVNEKKFRSLASTLMTTENQNDVRTFDPLIDRVIPVSTNRSDFNDIVQLQGYGKDLLKLSEGSNKPIDSRLALQQSIQDYNKKEQDKQAKNKAKQESALQAKMREDAIQRERVRFAAWRKTHPGGTIGQMRAEEGEAKL